MFLKQPITSTNWSVFWRFLSQSQLLLLWEGKTLWKVSCPWGNKIWVPGSHLHLKACSKRPRGLTYRPPLFPGCPVPALFVESVWISSHSSAWLASSFPSKLDKFGEIIIWKLKLWKCIHVSCLGLVSLESLWGLLEVGEGGSPLAPV